MQKHKALLLVGAATLVVATIIWLSSRSTSGDDSGKEKLVPQAEVFSRKSAHEEPELPIKTPGTRVIETEDSPSEEANGAAVAREKILEEINDAAITYDAAGLPKIEPYLTHPDEEIREAARNGMITLGDVAAGALLRKAAAFAPTPQEAVKLLEAADYVELPSGSLIRKKN